MKTANIPVYGNIAVYLKYCARALRPLNFKCTLTITN